MNKKFCPKIKKEGKVRKLELFEEYKDVVNIEDLMKMLCIGRNKAYELVITGQIKSFKIGKVYKIPKRWVIDYIEFQ